MVASRGNFIYLAVSCGVNLGWSPILFGFTLTEGPVSAAEAPQSQKMITIFGYGSLMHEEWAKDTMPSLKNHRKGILHGYSRRFNMVSINLIKNGTLTKADYAKKNPQVGVVSIRKDDSEAKNATTAAVYGALFEIPQSELPAYKAREARYKFETVNVDDPNDGSSVTALVCVEADDDYLRSLYQTDADYYEDVGKYYAGRVWGRTDIKPSPFYLRRVRDAAAKLGPDVLNDFIANTLLADGRTSVGEHLKDLYLSEDLARDILM